MMEIKNNWGW